MYPGQSLPVDPSAALAEFERALAALPDWQALLVIVVLSLGIARLVQVGGDRLISRVTRRIDGEVDDIVLRGIHPAGYVTVVLVGAYLAREPIGLTGALDLQVTAAILSVLTVVWALTLVRVGRKVSRELDQRGGRPVGGPHLPERLVVRRPLGRRLSAPDLLEHRRDPAARLGGYPRYRHRPRGA
jgi:hypothetical protein